MKKTEASQFKWAKWKSARYAGLEMPSSACGLIDGDFCFIEFTCNIQSYSHISFIHSFKYIYMHINIHAHIACIQVSFMKWKK